MSILVVVLAVWIGANIVVMAAIGLAGLLRSHRTRRQVARLEGWLRLTPLAPRSHDDPAAHAPERVSGGA